jgi:hypothetical protein
MRAGGVARCGLARRLADVDVGLVLWLRPGNAFAARPAKAATSAPDAARAIDVLRRSRRSPRSRSMELCRMPSVEQRYMKLR